MSPASDRAPRFSFHSGGKAVALVRGVGGGEAGGVGHATGLAARHARRLVHGLAGRSDASMGCKSAACGLIVLVFAACAVREDPPPGPEIAQREASGWVHDFEAPLGMLGLPQGWELSACATAGLQSAWGAARGRLGGRALAVLEGRGFGDALHVALLPEPATSRGSIETSLRALGGDEVRGGGLVLWWDAERWLAVLLEPRRGLLVVRERRLGRTRELARAGFVGQGGDWHRLKVEWQPGALVATAGAASVRIHLPASPGRLGLAVPGDAETAFDDLRGWR